MHDMQSCQKYSDRRVDTLFTQIQKTQPILLRYGNHLIQVDWSLIWVGRKRDEKRAPNCWSIIGVWLWTIVINTWIRWQPYLRHIGQAVAWYGGGGYAVKRENTGSCHVLHSNLILIFSIAIIIDKQTLTLVTSLAINDPIFALASQYTIQAWLVYRDTWIEYCTALTSRLLDNSQQCFTFLKGYALPLCLSGPFWKKIKSLLKVSLLKSGRCLTYITCKNHNCVFSHF